MKEQPAWVCLDCGNKLGARPKNENSSHVSTWHNESCGVCLQYRSVTEPRDFGYLNKGDYKD